eukprot:TRINITY_DN5746_c0_g1_i1.p2 TRINITY_DN5746_c0_g1~~TRINITY_DN5746_c0_g1_i1.p2  ORF type:complete len:303 (-),score=142.04 TRINITY_DN5746_c0_g1_i1:27-935(-)
MHRLTRIFGTEEDRVNCPFFYKIGACRHGEGCSRTHVRPPLSETIMVPHMYLPPLPRGVPLQSPEFKMPDDTEQFHDFYEDILDEFGKYGEILELNVLENLGEHMLGNVYVKYRRPEDAEKALQAINGRWYDGRRVNVEFSPVTDFFEARCRDFDEKTCARGHLCNFIHLKHMPLWLHNRMQRMNAEHRRKRGRSRSKSRSRSRSRSRSGSPRSRSRYRSASEERRARIHRWNVERQERLAKEKKMQEAAVSQKQQGQQQAEQQGQQPAEQQQGQQPAEQQQGKQQAAPPAPPTSMDTSADN